MNLLSRLTFSWLNRVVWKGFRSTLEISDLYSLEDKSSTALFARRYRATKAITHSLHWRLFYLVKFDLLLQGIWAIITSIAVFIPPILMRFILQYLATQDWMSRSNAWICVSGLLLSGLVTTITDSQCNWIGRKISAKLRSILVSDIYGKILRRRIEKDPPAATETPNDDESNTEDHVNDVNILNLISVDVEVVSGTSANLHLVWIIFPVQTTLGTYLLYRMIGASGLLGVLAMFILMPLSIWVSKCMAAVQGQVLGASDARIQSSNELLQNIRTVKYCGWDVFFREQIMTRRGLEMKKIRLRFIWWSIQMTLFHSLPAVLTGMTCFFYTVVFGNDLETSIAFPLLAMFAVLRIPLDRMADSVTFLIQANVSLLRISEFLSEREVQNYVETSISDIDIVGFDNATLVWPVRQTINEIEEEANPLTENVSFRLHEITARLQKGKVNVICGPSGSGKSSLLLALLGEMDLISGRVFLPHQDVGQPSTSYCPQEPWIMNQSIQENILFGLPFDGSRYEAVIHAVALSQDLAALDQGDQTLAGENGSRLSGGQKQRVALARALYTHSDYVILDDCLSALDSQTATHVFFHAIKGQLMNGRTCIFATHHMSLVIDHCDYIVMLHAGEIKAKGTAEELVSGGFIDGKNINYGMNTQPNIEFGNKRISELPSSVSSTKQELPISPPMDSATLFMELETGLPGRDADYVEKKSEGSVPWPVIKTYLTVIGPWWYWLIVLLSSTAQQVVALGTNLWIKRWAFQYDELALQPDSDMSPPDSNANRTENVADRYYLTIYVTICVTYALISFLRDLAVFYGSLKASSQLYERLLDSILRARLLFFDRVPLGQITNRFSRDIEVLDQSIAGFFISALQLVSSLAMIITFISIVLPDFLLVAPLIVIAYCCVTALYIGGARDLKRIEAIQRSPLYQQFGETLTGSVSIRAYTRTAMLSTQIFELLDRLNQPYLLLWASKEWLAVRVGALSSLISFLAGAMVLWNLQHISPGVAGLVLAYTASFTENVLWLVQIYALVQQDLNSVDRILEYTNIEQEPLEPLKPLSIQSLPHNWPSQGVVAFHNYTTRYGPDLEASLKDISFEARAGERIAIVGRTGAGKSTLALALIRGIEANEGHIEIDGIDIASVTLKRLRQAVTIVPQDPKLFDGSLRDNLSPLRIIKDEEMLEALRAVHILGTTDSHPNPITYHDLDRAANTLSLGQRQLLCIARAILRRSRVLVLDEATASVDHQTDLAIQGALRATIATGTTVLTIAHRLASIADSDQIVVLSAGRIIEQGSIRNLLSRRGEHAAFRQMCEDSGNVALMERLSSKH